MTHVINLGPHSNDGALRDEATSVTALGMEYIYIPVDFDAPTEEDFTKFEKEMERLNRSKIHVHCIYNARVSAFMFKRAKRMDARVNDAYDIMDGIWGPRTIWANLLGIEPPKNGKNQYLGYDY